MGLSIVLHHIEWKKCTFLIKLMNAMFSPSVIDQKIKMYKLKYTSITKVVI